MKTTKKQLQLPEACPDCDGSGRIEGSSDNKLIYVKCHKCHKCKGFGMLNIPEWRKKELTQAFKEERDMEKHLETKIPIELDNFMSMLTDVPNKIRLKIIKSLIWTANSQEEMLNMVSNLVASKKFRETID